MIDWTREVRKISREGYLVIPAVTRRLIDIKKGDSMVFYIDDDKIVLKRYSPSYNCCVFCGNAENLIEINNKHVCQNCMNELIK